MAHFYTADERRADEMVDLTNSDQLFIVSSQSQLDIINLWLAKNDYLPAYMGEREIFPVAIDVLNSTWTHSLSKKGYTYLSFTQFEAAVVTAGKN